MSKIYNPFNKGFWAKDNLFASAEEMAQIRATYNKEMKEIRETEYVEPEWATKMNAMGDKLQVQGRKMQKQGLGIMGLGGKLFLGVMLPLILTFTLGIIGFALGIIIAIMVFKPKKKSE